jgi:hypothetical protein
LSAVFQPDPKTAGQMKIGRHVLCCQMQRLNMNTGTATDDEEHQAVPAGKKIAQS